MVRGAASGSTGTSDGTSIFTGILITVALGYLLGRMLPGFAKGEPLLQRRIQSDGMLGVAGREEQTPAAALGMLPNDGKAVGIMAVRPAGCSFFSSSSCLLVSPGPSLAL